MSLYSLPEIKEIFKKYARKEAIKIWLDFDPFNSNMFCSIINKITGIIIKIHVFSNISPLTFFGVNPIGIYHNKCTWSLSERSQTLWQTDVGKGIMRTVLDEPWRTTLPAMRQYILGKMAGGEKGCRALFIPIKGFMAKRLLVLTSLKDEDSLAQALIKESEI